MKLEQSLAERLGFRIDAIGPTAVIVQLPSGWGRTATESEVALWRECERLEETIRAIAAQIPADLDGMDASDAGAFRAIRMLIGEMPR